MKLEVQRECSWERETEKDISIYENNEQVSWFVFMKEHKNKALVCFFFLSLVFNLLFWHSFILTDCTSSRKIPFYSVSPNILLRLLHLSLFFLSLDIVVDTDRYMYRCMYMCVNIYTCIFYIYISLIIFSEIFKSSSWYSL